MTRQLALALMFSLAITSCVTTTSEEPDRVTAEEVFARYVDAWIEGGAGLAESVTGPAAPRLTTALEFVGRERVVRTTIEKIETISESPPLLEGTVRLHFTDGSFLELSPRAEVVDELVRATPEAITGKLTEWRALRIEEFGSPTRGDILGTNGELLATGTRGHRAVTRDALAPAIALIDESLDTRLAAKRGRRLVAVRPRTVVASSRPVDGADVATSLDGGLQAAAEKVFGDRPGALVAIDPPSGGIRALVSNPGPEAPTRSPASSAYSPGSTFKLVTAAAALESSIFKINDIVPCPATMFVLDRQITNFRDIGYGPITFEKAFSVSCNTAFARVGMTIGTDRLLRMASRLGIRVGTIDETGGIAVPRSESELAVLSFGASGSLVTPLQMAGIATAVARGGTWVVPRWTDEPIEGTRVFESTTADALTTMMEEVVVSGTGQSAAIPGVQIAAKTGTAQTKIGANVPTDAWFVAIAPSRTPRLVIVAFLPRGGLGGGLSASLTRDYLKATINRWD